MKCSKVLDCLALLLFDLLAFAKGYRFVQVRTPEQGRHFELVYEEEGVSFPVDIKEKLNQYKEGTVRFIAYYKNQPAGVVRLGNPKIANRPFGLHGVDPEGRHFEIQSLVVSKDFRDGSQFVMLGLFKTLYCYSLSHGILSWIACSNRNVFLTIRRFIKNVQIIAVDFNDNAYPASRCLRDRNVFDTCYSMQVIDFSPWGIFKKFIRFVAKKSHLFSPIKFNLVQYESLSYGIK